VEYRTRHVPGIVIGRDARTAVLQHLPVADGAVADAQRSRRLDVLRRDGAATGHEHLSPARVDDGTAPSAPAASASSVETPAPSIPSARASPRATARPIRVPVKLPGPVPTTSASRSDVRADPCRRSASTSSSRVLAIDERSPSTSPSSRSALVATSVAVSKARISTRDLF
jgi:hypothetical protein